MTRTDLLPRLLKKELDPSFCANLIMSVLLMFNLDLFYRHKNLYKPKIRIYIHHKSTKAIIEIIGIKQREKTEEKTINE